ncbi:MAG: glycosyltransferase family 39 protein [Thermoanaerobaculia bacterium]
MGTGRSRARQARRARRSVGAVAGRIRRRLHQTLTKDEKESLGRWLVPASFVVALFVRLVGLGGSSMWLDEIMESLMAKGDLRQLFSSLIFDRAQPPVEPLLTWLLQHLGFGELARRVVNLLFVSGAIAILARWVRRRFGVATAGLAALLLAVSPMLLRYSHELRPYALALLFFCWALDATDRWLTSDRSRFPLEITVAAGLASLTHYLAIAVWLPIAAAWWAERGRASGASLPAWRLMLSPLVASLPLAFWFALLTTSTGPRWSLPVTHWSLVEVERRFRQLMLWGAGGQEIPRYAVALFAVLLVTGLALASRRREGVVLSAGLVGGTILVELALLAAGRFSHLRYNIYALPFLFAAVALGVVRLSSLVARWKRVVGGLVGILLVAALVVPSLAADVEYARHGRPDWPAIARAVRALDGDAAEVAVSSPWAMISIGYYLDRYSSWPEAPQGIELLQNDRNRLVAAVGRATGCHLVLVAGGPLPSAEFVDGLRPKRPVLFLPDTDQARLFRFAGPETGKRSCFPPPDFRPEPTPGYGRLFPWLHSAPEG